MNIQIIYAKGNLHIIRDTGDEFNVPVTDLQVQTSKLVGNILSNQQKLIVFTFGVDTLNGGEIATAGEFIDAINAILPTDTQTITGSVTVSNFPATQAVSGTVSVGNFPANQTISGSVTVSNFPANQTISGTVSVTDLTNGNQKTQLVLATTNASSDVTSFPAVNTSAQLIAADSTRKGMIITNLTNKTLQVSIGRAWTATSFTYTVAANGIIEVPSAFVCLPIHYAYTTGGAAISGSVSLTISK